LVCSETSALDIHHIDQNREHNEPENLICLCAVCHRRAHAGSITVAELRIYKSKAAEENEEIRKLKAEVERLTGDKEVTVSESYNSLRDRYGNVFAELTDKLFVYQAFIYLLTPFYTDRRGDEVRKKIRQMLSITVEVEQVILDKLLEINWTAQTGDLVYAQDKDAAKVVINELLKNNQLDVTAIIKTFL
jgi:hypothetical protein